MAAACLRAALLALCFAQTLEDTWWTDELARLAVGDLQMLHDLGGFLLLSGECEMGVFHWFPKRLTIESGEKWLSLNQYVWLLLCQVHGLNLGSPLQAGC